MEEARAYPILHTRVCMLHALELHGPPLPLSTQPSRLGQSIPGQRR